MNASLLNQAKRLPVEEQLELVEALWDNLCDLGAAPVLTEAQRVELDRRLADHEKHPEEVAPWSEVKAGALARIGR